MRERERYKCSKKYVGGRRENDRLAETDRKRWRYVEKQTDTQRETCAHTQTTKKKDRVIPR